MMLQIPISKTTDTFQVEDSINHRLIISIIFGFQDILYQHVYPYSNDLHHFLGKKIFLYRNPLDYLVSAYHYFEKEDNLTHRPIVKYQFNHVIDFYVHEFARSYSMVKHIHTHCDHVHLVSYESLKNEPFATFELLLKFMNIPIKQKSIAKAFDFSELKITRSDELNGIKCVPFQTGSHARSGKIGQWTSYFSKRQLKKVTSILNDYNIDLNEFILE